MNKKCAKLFAGCKKIIIVVKISTLYRGFSLKTTRPLQPITPFVTRGETTAVSVSTWNPLGREKNLNSSLFAFAIESQLSRMVTLLKCILCHYIAARLSCRDLWKSSILFSYVLPSRVLRVNPVDDSCLFIEFPFLSQRTDFRRFSALYDELPCSQTRTNNFRFRFDKVSGFRSRSVYDRVDRVNNQVHRL